MTTIADVIVWELSLGSYQSQLKGIVRSLWTGNIDRRSFNAQMKNAITFGLLDAWSAGARVCGIASGMGQGQSERYDEAAAATLANGHVGQSLE